MCPGFPLRGIYPGEIKTRVHTKPCAWTDTCNDSTTWRSPLRFVFRRLKWQQLAWFVCVCVSAFCTTCLVARVSAEVRIQPGLWLCQEGTAKWDKGETAERTLKRLTATTSHGNWLFSMVRRGAQTWRREGQRSSGGIRWLEVCTVVRGYCCVSTRWSEPKSRGGRRGIMNLNHRGLKWDMTVGVGGWAMTAARYLRKDSKEKGFRRNSKASLLLFNRLSFFYSRVRLKEKKMSSKYKEYSYLWALILFHWSLCSFANTTFS